MGSSSYLTNLDGEVVQHIEYIGNGEVFLEEKNSKWNTPYLFTSKELDKETGWNYFGARYQDPKLGIFLSVDPLAEKYAGWSSYAYALNNPVKYTDPTGMSADPPTGVDAENGQVHTDSKGTWIYDKASTTWRGQNGAKDLGNTIELDNVNIKGYKESSYYQGYFDTYKHINGKNLYSPYTPDGYAISLYGSLNYNLVSFGGSGSLVLDGNTNQIAGFGSLGTAVSTSMPFSLTFGISIDVLDKYDAPGVKNNDTLFERYKGYSLGGDANIGNWGVRHSQSALFNEKTGQFEKMDNGIISNGIQYNFKPSTGGSYGAAKTVRLF